MGWTPKSVVPLLLIAVPLCGFCATALYLIYRKGNESEFDEFGIKPSRTVTIETKIPKSSVGVVIGRGGSTIKSIQEDTNTRINFRDDCESEDFRTCLIRGSAEATQMAEAMIQKIIWNQPVIEIIEMWVPARVCGRIIGRCGETIRNISKASNARINIEPNGNQNNEKRIVIKGTTEQIAVAQSLIEEKVEEDAEIRRKMELSQTNRSPRSKANSPVDTTASSKNGEKERKEASEPLIATGSDGYLEVYVSAVADPGCFWVQVRSPKSVELDHLVDEMTEYYSQEENKQIHAIKELAVGQIVTAPFPIVDNRWYRGEVRAIEPNEQDVSESRVDLYYVDYGDSEYLKQRELFQLRTDFLTLRFQAIECNLANVKPSGDGDKWSEQATDLFEELCHVAQWRPMLAKVITFKEKRRQQREGSPVPCISLVDPSGSQDIDIAEELIKQGFAVKDESMVAENAFAANDSGTSGDTKLMRNKHTGESKSLTSPTEVNDNLVKQRWVSTYDAPDTREDWDM